MDSHILVRISITERCREFLKDITDRYGFFHSLLMTQPVKNIYSYLLTVDVQ